MKRAISRKNLWETTPLWLRSSLGRALAIMPPHWMLGRTFRNQRRHTRKAQWWSADQAKDYQLRRLREILTLAYHNAPFYRRIFDRVGFHPAALDSLDVIESLPTIDRQTVTANIADMCTRRLSGNDVDCVSTGGVSGRPLHFYLDASRSAIEYAYLTTSWMRAGYELGMPMATLRGQVVRADRHGLYHEYDPVLRHHYYSSFHLSDENIERYLEHMAAIGPCFLHVYPSTAAALARFILRTGKTPPRNVQGLIAESEIVYPEQRQVIEEVLSSRLFSCYGQSEKVVLAAGCEQSDDYHVWPTYGYFELLDEKGHPITTPGQRGEIVGTGFINTIMPFVRYRTGDWATYVSNHCAACGREHTVIRDVLGHRTQEVLVAADGSEIPWVALNMHDDTFIRVRRFQFIQKIPGKAILCIVPGTGFSENDVERIRRNLERKLNSQLRCVIKQVDAIPLSARGKTIYVDQQIPHNNSKLTHSAPSKKKS